MDATEENMGRLPGLVLEGGERGEERGGTTQCLTPAVGGTPQPEQCSAPANHDEPLDKQQWECQRR